MRIPTSVIVMSLVTAVPFGLGIRDTLNHKGAHADDELSGLDFGGGRSARERQRALDEYEAEMRREAADREARAKARLEKLDQLYGAKPAQMGALLDGITLGAGAGSFQPENVRQRIENASRDGLLFVAFDTDAKALKGVEVRLTSDYESGDVCEKLDEKLTAAWGKPTNGAWLDPATHQRATLDHEVCLLRFDTYAEPGDWVAQLPLSGVGTSIDKLAEQVGGDYEDGELTWHLPGLRYGKGATILTALSENGKVTGIRIDVGADFDSMLAVRDALSAKLKAQPQKQDGDEYSSFQTYEWKRKVPVVLETTDTNKFALVIGKLSWD
jgi:hypothetical protein